MINSIARHIEPSMIVAQLRMERQKHKGCFLLVEGSTDAKRIFKFVDSKECSIVNCYGKPNVIGAIELMQDIGIEDCLGLVDADFERIMGTLVDRDCIIHSERHDLDLDNAFTAVIDRYLLEVADQGKLEAAGGVRPCLENILSALKPLSVLRYVNQYRNLRYKLNNIDLELFFDGANLDVDSMIECVSVGSFSDQQSKNSLRNHINDMMDLEFDLHQLTNGHDFIAALGISLRNFIGNRRHPQTWRSEVEMHLRFGFSREDFCCTSYYRDIRAWEEATGKIVVTR